MVFDFGYRLKNLRQQHHLTQTQVANRLNLSKTSISGYENNVKTPSQDVLIKLAGLYRVSLSGELYRDNWIGKKATEAANAIAKERNFVQSQDIGKVNKAEIKEAMDGVLKKMQGFDFTKFKEELGKRGFKVREARASTGKLNGYYVTARSGTEYKASEIGKGYTLAHIERTQSKLKCNSMNISHGNKLTPGSGSFQR